MNLLRQLFRWIYSHYMNIRLRSRHVTVMSCADIRGSHIEGHNIIWPKVYFKNCSLGLGSYIGESSFFIDAEIGRFCSIAPNVKMLLGRHPTRDFVSTHPAFFSSVGQAGFTFVSKSIFKENKWADQKLGRRIIVGNDVWVGSGVVILEGCTIGNGAIIGTNSVVANDVEPYSIVVGVPAKHIRYRFDENERNFLQEYQWWNKDLEWIQNNSVYFNNIETFIEKTNSN